MALHLVLLVLLQPAIQATLTSSDPEPTWGSLTIPVPTNLTFEAYNLNTLLHWDYPRTRETPVFNVMVKTYTHGKWINACNTSHHYCDISSQIEDPSVSLWARVKAYLGQKESTYAESKEFILCRHGKYAPPTLSIGKKKDRLIIDTYHPLTVVTGEELEQMYDDDTCHMFSYHIYIRIDENKTINITCDPFEEDYETVCRSSIPLGIQKSNYCVSAQGVSVDWGVKTEMSQDLCITISKDTHNWLNSFLIPTIVAFIVFLVFIVIFAYCRMKEINPFKRKSITLPKSLAIIPGPEKVPSEELLPPATVLPMHPEDNPEKAECRELCSESEVVTTDTDISEVTPENSLNLNSRLSSSNQSDPCSFALNSYHSRNGSDSGLVESGSFVSDSEFSSDSKTKGKTEIQEGKNTTSFGYDKPHVLVDLLVDEGGKESLIGYRLTAESKEFS
ncbi:interferon gamma receptor 1 isoform X2 [Sorex fumeus]|uniref:interferon gamma receptor 1 isoform X2 n=1 Tax=Sorex fumeus TaxID=62283 RepID=UPI0024ADA24D|nr:interferon gamma receptor 1 isoform X2 [Sorex fumeus]